jgi:hypothetical protein
MERFATMNNERVVIVERHLKLTPRVCVVCGQGYSGWGRQRFCSKPCQRRWDYLQHAEQRRANRRDYYRRREKLLNQ